MAYYSARDQIGAIVEKKKQNYLGEYIPEKFWSEVGEIYDYYFRDKKGRFIYHGNENNSLTLNLPQIISRINEFQPKSILEVGCGFGRCLPFVMQAISSLEKIVGVEFSPTMIEQSKDYLTTYYRGNEIQIVNGDARVLPFKDKEFELIYTHVCLTHIPPEFIHQVVSEISRVAKDAIVHVERFAFLYEHPNPHRWSHLLPPLYIEKGWKLHEYDNIKKEHETKILVLRRD